MKFLALMLVIDAACVSPFVPHSRRVEVYKVPCAWIVSVDIHANPFKEAQEPNAISGGASATREAPKAASASLARPAKARKRLSRLCGAERPVWYTNKAGKRKYRCR